MRMIPKGRCTQRSWWEPGGPPPAHVTVSVRPVEEKGARGRKEGKVMSDLQGKEFRKRHQSKRHTM